MQMLRLIKSLIQELEEQQYVLKMAVTCMNYLEIETSIMDFKWLK